MSTTVYIQGNKSADISHSEVHLRDLAQVVCPDKKLENRCKELIVVNLKDKLPGSYVVKAADLIQKVQTEYSETEVTMIGPPEIVLAYQLQTKQNPFLYGIKILFICLIVFFGAGFSIMTFNTDVGSGELFSSLYKEITGQVSDGFTELELCYSIGIGIGVVFFFNHFHFKKEKSDPTALEVKMSTYESDVITTILNQEAKKHATDHH